MARSSRIDAAQVRRIADLAHLSLSDEEISFYQTHLEKILSYVGQLEAVDVAKTAIEHLVPNAEREDEVRPSLDPSLAVAQAPTCTGTSFRVPRIVE